MKLMGLILRCVTVGFYEIPHLLSSGLVHFKYSILAWLQNYMLKKPCNFQFMKIMHRSCCLLKIRGHDISLAMTS